MTITKTLYIDMDGVLVDLQSNLDKQGWHQNVFKDPPPMKGAVEAFNELCFDEDYDVYILSNISTKTASNRPIGEKSEVYSCTPCGNIEYMYRSSSPNFSVLNMPFHEKIFLRFQKHVQTFENL